jgi:hypothetical protein
MSLVRLCGAIPIRRARSVAPALAALLLAIALPINRAAAVDNSPSHRPVLVELFTSEGCSSCPPADELLARIDAQKSVGGTPVVVLSEHVTYWDRPEWHDPYSLESVTDRQQDYGARFHLDSVYTPQALVDGEVQMTGSDAAALLHAIAQAASSPGINLAIEGAQLSGNEVHFKVGLAQGATAPANASLTAALADDSAQTAVSGGENAGHTLRYVAVVRVMKDLGKGAFDGRTFELKASDAGKSGPLRLVVFAADRKSGHVIGVAEQKLSR